MSGNGFIGGKSPAGKPYAVSLITRISSMSISLRILSSGSGSGTRRFESSKAIARGVASRTWPASASPLLARSSSAGIQTVQALTPASS